MLESLAYTYDKVTGVQYARATLSWPAVTLSDGGLFNVQVQSYELFVREEDDEADAFVLAASIPGTLTTGTLPKYHTGQTIQVQLRAVGYGGVASDFSDPLDVVLPPDTTAPSAPTGFTGTREGKTVKIAWDGTLTAGIPPDFDRVEIERSGTSGFTFGTGTKVTGFRSGGTYVVGSNEPNNAIYFQAVAFDVGGNASTATSLTVDPDTTAPSKPAGMTVDQTLGVIGVSWDGTLDLGAARPDDWAGVEIHMGSASGFTISSSTLIGLMPGRGTLAISGQTAGVEKFFQARSVDILGNASAALTVGSTTPEAVVDFNPADRSIEGIKLAEGAVGFDEIAAEAIYGDKLAANAVEAGKIAAGALDAFLITAPNMQSSSTAGTSTAGFTFNTDGLKFFNDAALPTVDLDGATGNAVITGEFATDFTTAPRRIQIVKGDETVTTVPSYDDGENVFDAYTVTASTQSIFFHDDDLPNPGELSLSKALYEYSDFSRTDTSVLLSGGTVTDVDTTKAARFSTVGTATSTGTRLDKTTERVKTFYGMDTQEGAVNIGYYNGYWEPNSSAGVPDYSLYRALSLGTDGYHWTENISQWLKTSFTGMGRVVTDPYGVMIHASTSGAASAKGTAFVSAQSSDQVYVTGFTTPRGVTLGFRDYSVSHGSGPIDTCAALTVGAGTLRWGLTWDRTEFLGTNWPEYDQSSFPGQDSKRDLLYMDNTAFRVRSQSVAMALDGTSNSFKIFGLADSDTEVSSTYTGSTELVSVDSTGVTVDSGQIDLQSTHGRILMNDTSDIQFFDSSDVRTFQVHTSGTYAYGRLYFRTVGGTGSGSYIESTSTNNLIISTGASASWAVTGSWVLDATTAVDIKVGGSPNFQARATANYITSRTYFRPTGNTTATGAFIESTTTNTLTLNASQIYLPDMPSTVNAGAVVRIGAQATGNIVWYANTSSRRYKTNIKPLEADLRWLETQPVVFNYKADAADLVDVEQPHWGLIAEDLHDAGLTEWVVYKDIEGLGNVPDSIDYEPLPIIELALIQRQEKLIQALSERLTELEARLSG